MNNKFVKILAIFLVVALAVSAGFLFQGKSLKAADEEAVQVEAPAAPEPVVEVQEIVVSEEVAAPVVDEAAEEGEPAAETEEAAEPADGEDAEEVEDAEDAEEAEDEEEEEERNLAVHIWYECADEEITYGSVVNFFSSVSGTLEGDTVLYQWQYFDGVNWQNVAGANASTFVLTIDEANAGYSWRLHIDIA